MRGALDFPDGYEEDYVPAATEYNLEQAHRMLEQLYRVALERIPEAGEGDCADCGRHGLLLRYGLLSVCRHCALSRRAARR